MALEVNQLLQDRYRVVRIIKSGGMGSVYEACDTKLADSPCAVKEIHEAALASKDSQYIQGRFYEEMKALVHLDHASIPKVRDYVQSDETVYLVMELVQGESLDDEIRARLEAATAPAVEGILQDILQLLDTLDYLHSQNPPVVHRDIKPANILRDRRNGMIKLVDFGLARELQNQKTQTVVGTMGYCAPEQLMGKSEPRSDIYSVGVTMAHLLTGQAPEMVLFESRKPELPGLRPGLVEIISRATQPQPGDRYPTAKAMAHDLRNWLQGGTAALLGGAQEATRPVASLSPATSPGKNLIPLAVLAVAASLGLGMWAGRPKSPPTPARALAPSSTPVPDGNAASLALGLWKRHKAELAKIPPPPPPRPVAETVREVRPPTYNPAPQPAYRPPPRSVQRPKPPRPRPVYREPAREPIRVRAHGRGLEVQVRAPIPAPPVRVKLPF